MDTIYSKYVTLEADRVYFVYKSFSFPAYKI